MVDRDQNGDQTVGFWLNDPTTSQANTLGAVSPLMLQKAL